MLDRLEARPEASPFAFECVFVSMCLFMCDITCVLSSGELDLQLVVVVVIFVGRSP